VINRKQVVIDYNLPVSPTRGKQQEAEALPIEPFGGPNRTFAKPVESFFELSIIAAPSVNEGRGDELK
jgi:hypothetical protein